MFEISTKIVVNCGKYVYFENVIGNGFLIILLYNVYIILNELKFLVIIIIHSATATEKKNR